MDSLGLGTTNKAPNELDPQHAQELRKLRIGRCINSLVHTSRCESQDCAQTSCVKIKNVLAHQKTCKQNIEGECQICKQIFALCCYHAKDCSDDQCAVTFCRTVKPKLM